MSTLETLANKVQALSQKIDEEGDSERRHHLCFERYRIISFVKRLENGELSGRIVYEFLDGPGVCQPPNSDVEFKEFIGHTFVSIEISEDKRLVHFLTIGGEIYSMYHRQDCCEDVALEDVVGDLDDVMHQPIIQAEEVSKSTHADNCESETWTFYKLATIKGSVTLRWYGTSNGYYSEEVSIARNFLFTINGNLIY